MKRRGRSIQGQIPKSSTVIGIDPGKKGAIAIYFYNKWEIHTMPLIGKDIDEKTISQILKQASGLKNVIAFIEKVHAMPGQGVTSMFNFGMGYGMLRMALTAHNIPYVLVTPQAWKKKVLAGLPKDKESACNYVSRRWPSVNLLPGMKRKPHDGIADAVCIGTYGILL